ncbi:MAG: hypothetical protein IPF47_24525 [Gemmatimonadetes bacterium]|nr:hypothetical protein [Gemmatimonadota bacterium]
MYRWLKQGLQVEPLAVIQARLSLAAPGSSLLAAFTALIQSRLAEYPDLSATRLFA